MTEQASYLSWQNGCCRLGWQHGCCGGCACGCQCCWWCLWLRWWRLLLLLRANPRLGVLAEVNALDSVAVESDGAEGAIDVLEADAIPLRVRQLELLHRRDGVLLNDHLRLLRILGLPRRQVPRGHLSLPPRGRKEGVHEVRRVDQGDVGVNSVHLAEGHVLDVAAGGVVLGAADEDEATQRPEDEDVQENQRQKRAEQGVVSLDDVRLVLGPGRVVLVAGEHVADGPWDLPADLLVFLVDALADDAQGSVSSCDARRRLLLVAVRPIREEDAGHDKMHQDTEDDQLAAREHGARRDEERRGQDAAVEQPHEDGLDHVGVALGQVPLGRLEQQVELRLRLGLVGEEVVVEAQVGQHQQDADHRRLKAVGNENGLHVGQGFLREAVLPGRHQVQDQRGVKHASGDKLEQHAVLAVALIGVDLEGRDELHEEREHGIGDGHEHGAVAVGAHDGV
eukprot:scaffold293_cov248-Pinguiococcus_pyrenoidosus.AAC.7